MGRIGTLKPAEQVELLNARICTIESFLSQSFEGFFYDIENFAVNEIEKSALTRAQKDVCQATLLEIRSQYKAKGKAE